MTNRLAIAHIHTTGPNTERDFIIQLGVFPLDGRNKPQIQRFRPECSLSRSDRERSGIKDSDLSDAPLYGTEISKWKKIFTNYDTIFVLKTGSGDELAWMQKVVLDQKVNIEVVDLDRIIQVFLPGIKDKSFLGLYGKFYKKQLKSHLGLMKETLIMGEKILREIVYLYSKKESLLHIHLLDLTGLALQLPEFNAVYELVRTCKENGWLSDDLLAQPNPEHDDFDVHAISGRQILKDILPGEGKTIIKDIETEEELESISANTVKHFFESDFIKQNLPGYEKRDSQVDYAREVVNTLNDPMHNYVEAPTGIGKSLGYLVPSALFLEKNLLQKIVIATATKTLQNQVIEKDWPLIMKRFPNLKIAVLKGKSNYICISALARQFSHSFDSNAGAEDKAAWLAMALFTHHTEGDLEHVSYRLKKWMDPVNDLINDIRAHLHCTKSLCKPSGCVYGKHLSGAEQAHIIITNHYKAVMMNEGILGTTHALIIDEGERFGDNIRQALSIQINSWEVNQLLFRLKGNSKRSGFVQILEEKINEQTKKKGRKGKTAREAQDIARALTTSVEFVDLTLTQFIKDIFPFNGVVPPLMQHFPALRHSGDSLENFLEPVSIGFGQLIDQLKKMQGENIPISQQLKERCESYKVLVEELQGRFKEFSKGFMTRYYAHHFKGDPDEKWSLVNLPVSIHGHLNEAIYQYVGHILFTSATLYINNTPHHFMSDYGSYDVNEKTAHSSFPNVFSYDQKVVCIVDTSITPYSYRDPEQMDVYRTDVDKALCAYALATNGRTLVLFMSQKELNRSYTRTAGFFRNHDVLPLKQNGSSLEEIREFNRNEYSVLYGVDRFWAGVDFPGRTLSQVIIVKAPNPSLSDPLIAHQKLWDANFFQNKYPIYGKLKLRQGFGRLIRSMQDRGGVIILDSRYEISPWFYCHLDELPMQVTFTQDQEVIMRSVLGKSGLNTEFHERRIDPFLETENFDFSTEKAAIPSQNMVIVNKMKKAV